MVWLRNKKIKISVRTLNLSPAIDYFLASGDLSADAISFNPDQVRHPDGSKLFDTQIVFLKDSLEKADFRKSQLTTTFTAYKIVRIH